MSDARAPEIGLHAFAGRVACVVLALTALMAWRLIIGVATLDIDAATMKLTQRFTGAPMKRAETRAVVTTMTLDAPTSSEPRRARREVKERDAFARGAAAPPSDAPSDDAPSDDAPRATMEDLERLRASLRRIQGVEEDVDFIESLERDANSKSNPCWTAKDGATVVFPRRTSWGRVRAAVKSWGSVYRWCWVKKTSSRERRIFGTNTPRRWRGTRRCGIETRSASTRRRARWRCRGRNPYGFIARTART